MLNEEYAGLVNMVDSYAVDGFRLNDNTKILGPCIVFPTQVLGRWRMQIPAMLRLLPECISSAQVGGWRVQRK